MKFLNSLPGFPIWTYMDIAISLNGYHAAERNLEQAARKVASSNTPSPESADTLALTDHAAELIAAEQAKIAGIANLRVISVQTDLEHEALDLFA